MNIIRIKSTASTNLFLKERLKEHALAEGTVVWADAQTAGRGQSGTSWEAEPGKNITCSLLLYPSFLPPGRHFLLSETIALGIKDLVDDFIEGASIKWPNDIYYEDRKLAGILIENELSGGTFSQSVAGIGLNVNQEVFSSCAPNPVSLKQVTGRSFDREQLMDSLLRKISCRYGQLKAGEYERISQAYQASLYRKDGFHCYEDLNGRFHARLQGVDEDGTLHLATAQGEDRRYAFKEVSFINPSS